jgi:hypothetical protein
MNLTSTIMIFAGGPGSGCQGENCGRPSSGTKVTRGKDFERLGVYDVLVGNNKYQMYRDPESGMWYEEGTGKHFSQAFLGFNKKDAVAQLEKRISEKK